jgi:hypothetical protein
MNDAGTLSIDGRCGYCREPLPDNAVSDYFCSSGHQDLWHQARSEPLFISHALQREPTAMSIEY